MILHRPTDIRPGVNKTAASETIALQTAEFLARGGTVTEVAPDVFGEQIIKPKRGQGDEMRSLENSRLERRK